MSNYAILMHISHRIGPAARLAASGPFAGSVRVYSNSSTSLLRDTVARRDYNAFLTHFAYPTALQPYFFALRAFNAELASIKDDVSNELIGRVRMGWWRDAIRGVYEVRSTN